MIGSEVIWSLRVIGVTKNWVGDGECKRVKGGGDNYSHKSRRVKWLLVVVYEWVFYESAIMSLQ